VSTRPEGRKQWLRRQRARFKAAGLRLCAECKDIARHQCSGCARPLCKRTPGCVDICRVCRKRRDAVALRPPARVGGWRGQELAERCESPIERRLYGALLRAGLRQIRVQAPFLGYRCDFMIPGRNGCCVVVEADGAKFHSSPEAIARDRERDDAMSRRGAIVIRFTGSEIMRNAAACAAKVRRLAGLSEGSAGGVSA